MRLTKVTFKDPQGVHLDGATRYLLKEEEGYDIQITPMGLAVSKEGSLETWWVPLHLCTGGSFAKPQGANVAPGKKSALSEVIRGD